MRTSELVVRCLEAEGVHRIYGVPGEENIDFLDDLADSNIEFMLTKHEQSAAFLCAVQARLTGTPQVCLSTLGPGATNLMTGVADAYLSFAPVIALTGQAGVERSSPPQKQVLDLQSLFRPITKESLSIKTPGKAPLLIRRAFDIARQERPGPVHLELPEDVMRQEAQGHPVPRCEDELVRPDRRSLMQIAEMIAESKRPLLLVGDGVVRAGAVQAVQNFCRQWNIPAVNTWFAAGVIPFDDRNSLNTIGVRASDHVRGAYESADMMILAGFDMIEFQPKYWNIGEKKEVVYFGQVPLGHAEELVPDVQVIGSLKHLFSHLAELAQRKEEWAQEFRAHMHSLIEVRPKDKKGIRPQNLVHIIRQCLRREDVLVSDVGAHLLWLAKYYPVLKERTLVLDNGLISMGIGIPGAMGAKLAFPERKVITVCGDGSFMMTAAELVTAKEHDIPFVVMIWNDGGYGLIKLKMERSCGRSSGVSFQNPDFVKLAQSMGAEGYRVSDQKEVRSVLEDCLRRDVLAVIDVPVDYSENDKLLS